MLCSNTYLGVRTGGQKPGQVIQRLLVIGMPSENQPSGRCRAFARTSRRRARLLHSTVRSFKENTMATPRKTREQRQDNRAQTEPEPEEGSLGEQLIREAREGHAD